MSAELIARLIEAGTPAALVADVAMALGGAASDQRALSERRDRDAARQRQKRELEKMSRDITLGHVTSKDIADKSPAFDKEKSPRPSKEIKSTPCVIAPTHEAEPDCSTFFRIASAEIAIAILLAGAADIRRRRWKDMPPPEGVSDEIWKSFIEHRKSLRKSLTIGAYRPLVTKLAALADDNWPPGRVVEEIMERGWLTFKPEWLNRSDRRNGQRDHDNQRQGNRSAAHPGGRDCAAADIVFPVMDGGQGRD